MAKLPETKRSQVLFQHEVLRALFDRLDGAALRVLHDEPAVQELRDAQRTLQDVLEVHLRQEEGELDVLLRPGWGAERLDRMHADHTQALVSLRRQRDRNPKQSAAASRRLVHHLSMAMEEEERELLGASPPLTDPSERSAPPGRATPGSGNRGSNGRS